MQVRTPPHNIVVHEPLSELQVNFLYNIYAQLRIDLSSSVTVVVCIKRHHYASLRHNDIGLGGCFPMSIAKDQVEGLMAAATDDYLQLSQQPTIPPLVMSMKPINMIPSIVPRLTMASLTTKPSATRKRQTEHLAPLSSFVTKEQVEALKERLSAASALEYCWQIKHQRPDLSSSIPCRKQD
jgi:hypothetical protein